MPAPNMPSTLPEAEAAAVAVDIEGEVARAVRVILQVQHGLRRLVMPPPARTILAWDLGSKHSPDSVGNFALECGEYREAYERFAEMVFGSNFIPAFPALFSSL